MFLSLRLLTLWLRHTIVHCMLKVAVFRRSRTHHERFVRHNRLLPIHQSTNGCFHILGPRFYLVDTRPSFPFTPLPYPSSLICLAA